MYREKLKVGPRNKRMVCTFHGRLRHGLPSIGATTIGTGGDWSPNFYVGGPTMYWSPNFLAVVFKKQEISQQVVTRMQDLISI